MFRCVLLGCSLSSFINGDFEQGDATGWIIGGGNRNLLNSSLLKPEDYLPGGKYYTLNIAQTHSVIVNITSNHPLQKFMAPPVKAGDYAIRVEDTDAGGFVSVIRQRINSYRCMDIYYAWLGVLENGNHPQHKSSVIVVELQDSTTGDMLLRKTYDARHDNGGIDQRFLQSEAFFYTPQWQVEHLNISAHRLGHDFTLTILVSDCGPKEHRGYVFLDSFGGLKP